MSNRAIGNTALALDDNDYVEPVKNETTKTEADLNAEAYLDAEVARSIITTLLGVTARVSMAEEKRGNLQEAERLDKEMEKYRILRDTQYDPEVEKYIINVLPARRDELYARNLI
ncbi:hypothetical protein RsTz2092_07950 [Deferribacterales bacterium RsTz2092]|nr:hypothetical protein AGMMS49941_10570 [Deferribacterales bacterium]